MPGRDPRIRPPVVKRVVANQAAFRDVPDESDISPQIRVRLRAMEGQVIALARQVGHVRTALKAVIALVEGD